MKRPWNLEAINSDTECVYYHDDNQAELTRGSGARQGEPSNSAGCPTSDPLSRNWSVLAGRLYSVSLGLLFTIFLWLLWCAVGILMPGASKSDYGIVIDAGSHGSRLNIFSWDARVADVNVSLSGPVTIPKLVAVKLYAPGIETYAAFPAEGRKQILQMLIDAKDLLTEAGIPPSQWPKVPLYVKATAGMRALDQGARDAVMDSIRDFLQNREWNPFLFKRDFARVISGEEEGVYGWLAVNSAISTLLSPPAETVGALDMGGASTQITFSPLYTSVLEDFNVIHLGNAVVRLYSHSFLGYGWNDAFSRLSTVLSVRAINAAYRAEKITQIDIKKSALFHSGHKKQDAIIDVDHPCLLRGHTFMFAVPPLDHEGLRMFVDLSSSEMEMFLDIMNYPRWRSSMIVAAFSNGGLQKRHAMQDQSHTVQILKPNGELPLVVVRFRGRGDFEGCRMKANKFMAFGQYHKVWQMLKLPANPSLSAWSESATKLCNMSVPEIREYTKANSINVFSKKGILKSCWKATWIYTILVDGYGFSPTSQQISFSPNEDIDASPIVGWALGSMMSDVNFYPWDVPQRLLLLLYAISAVAVALTMVVIWLLRKQCSLRKKAEVLRLLYRVT